MEICNNACENHAANNELCAKNIKVKRVEIFESPKKFFFQEVLDKKFGPSWHVIVGEGFGFEISYETKKMFYMFSAGKSKLHYTTNLCGTYIYIYLCVCHVNQIFSFFAGCSAVCVWKCSWRNWSMSCQHLHLNKYYQYSNKIYVVRLSCKIGFLIRFWKR